MSKSDEWRPSTPEGWEAYYKLELLKLQHKKAEEERKKKGQEESDGLQK